jgi:hypothetical protein
VTVDTDTMLGWCHDVIDGVGGLHDFEKYELAVSSLPRDEWVASWVVRCLANSERVETQNIVDAIVAHRKGA